ncbi:MAG: mechanosensitive ion channel [Acidimicrobiia bacterium]|nr:mechanosensitive ion channel [Acidimicrobiia bacterium]
MSDLLADPAAAWALVLVVVLPVVIIGAAELEERLRQSDSLLTPVVSILRSWTIPFFAGWALTRGLFGLDGATLVVRLLGTGFILSAAAVALAVVRLLVAWLRSWGEAGEDRRGIPQLLLALPRVAVLIVTGWFLIDGVWGVDLSAALTALGVTSLVVSFALQDTLSGLASGALLLTDAPFKPGDWIQFGDLQGQVIDINWRSSRIRDRNGDLHVVPNSQLANDKVINYGEPSGLHRVVVPIQVAYVNPPTLAREMLLEAARSTPGVLEDPPPAVAVVQIDDPMMGYEVHMWIDDFHDAPRVASTFGSLVWYASHRHNVPLPSPAQDLYLYDGVEAGESGVPDRAEIRRRLRISALLDRLDDDALDQLAAAARAERFAENEVILQAGRENPGLHVLWAGSARMSIGPDEGSLLRIADFAPGDVFGLVGRSDTWPQPPSTVAITDCEVVIIDNSTAQSVTSHNPALASALNQVINARRRRIDRVVEAAETRAEQEAPSRESAGSTGSDEP